jgi:GTP-binding protein
MSRLPIVAVVGRPNVGKSTFVNRVLRRRAAVVEEKPGVTRDRREFRAEWSGRDFLLVDTGGWEVGGDELMEGIRGQAEAALGGADFVIFIADATTLFSDDDKAIARLVQASGVPHLLVANKADGERVDADLAHLWALGLGEPHPVSALHGRNIGDLLDEVVAGLPPDEEGEAAADPAERLPVVAIIGRPNVGKSTLLNTLVGQERVLVSPVPGTTRDPIDMVVTIGDITVRLYDTAGIRRRTKVDESTEFFSVVRAKEAIAAADVVLFVLDATQGVTHQEQRLAEEISEAGAAVVVVLNKWDAADPDDKWWVEDGVGDRLAFISWAPVLRMSALTGARIKRLGPAIETVLAARQVRIPTPELNRVLIRLQEAHPPPVRKGRRARILYSVQAGTEPPTIVLFVRGGELAPDYLRFLEGRLRSEYDFLGTPIRLVARMRTARERRD